MVHNEVDEFRSLMIKSFKIKKEDKACIKILKNNRNSFIGITLNNSRVFWRRDSGGREESLCSEKPCAEKPKPIRKAGIKDSAKLMEKGEKLWNDKSSGTSGASCATCHPNGKDLKRLRSRKYIKMADDILTLDQTINFCLLNPMKGKPLP